MCVSWLRSLRGLAVPVAIGAMVVAAVPGARAQDPAKDVLADQARPQGHACATALSAERDPARSRPDEPVWILRCSDATWRVRLIPDMAARIERLG
jgi:hypothetical protein